MSDYIVLECQAFPGNSGGPVYIRLDGRTIRDEQAKSITVIPPVLKLLGVIAAFYPEKQELQEINRLGKVETQVYTHFGISIAVPVNKIHDVLYSEVLMKARREEIEKKRREAPGPEPASVPDIGFTKEDFEAALRKVSRRITPSEPDEASS